MPPYAPHPDQHFLDRIPGLSSRFALAAVFADGSKVRIAEFDTERELGAAYRAALAAADRLTEMFGSALPMGAG